MWNLDCALREDDMVTFLQFSNMNDILPTLLKKDFGIGCSFYNLYMN
jgi:hypothetical protein